MPLSLIDIGYAFLTIFRLLSQPETQQGTTENNDTKILLIGGWHMGNKLQIYYPDQPSDGYFLPVEFKFGRHAHSSFLLPDGKILSVGGYHDHKYLKNGEVLDLNSMTVDPFPAELNIARGEAASAVLDGIPYICGGYQFGKPFYLSSCERLIDGRWEFISPMINPRDHPAMVALNGSLYVFGGTNGDEYLNSTERYDPETDTWQEIEPMMNRRSSHSVAVLNGQIYTCGGHGNRPYFTEVLASCEKFDPETNQWSSIASLNHKRRHHAMVNANGKLYVIGDWEISFNVEEYDVEADEWKEKHDLIEGVNQCTVVAFD